MWVHRALLRGGEGGLVDMIAAVEGLHRVILRGGRRSVCTCLRDGGGGGAGFRVAVQTVPG